MPDTTLYERLGGEEAIGAVVDEFYDRVLDDERVAHHFDDVEMAAQRTHQTTFLSAVAGGPIVYEGDATRETVLDAVDGFRDDIVEAA